MSAVTLHLGNGCSAAAIREGRSVDTSMGFTPLEGLVMGTRSGDIDPALLTYLARKVSVDAQEVERWLNQRSGLLGLSGLSNNMREIIAASVENPRAVGLGLVLLSRAQISRRVSGGARRRRGIGHLQRRYRRKCPDGAADDLRRHGLVRHHARRQANASVLGRDECISDPRSRLRAYVIQTDEEAIIARETARLFGGQISAKEGE